MQGMDVIAQAQSGTGKTATFSISILQQIDTGLRECQVPVDTKALYIYIFEILHPLFPPLSTKMQLLLLNVHTCFMPLLLSPCNDQATYHHQLLF